jgi:hypothetical protein
MKVYEYANPSWGKAFSRISFELRKHAPEWVEWVSSMDDCEIAIVHEVGGAETIQMRDALEKRKKLVIVQHTYFTSGYSRWEEIWEQAMLTTSFHNLPEYTTKKFEFHHTPWGADPDIFYLENYSRSIKVFSTGHVSRTENLDKVYDACLKTHNTMYHTGENFKYGLMYRFMPYMTDDKLRTTLNQTEYVPCLREYEGFELMGIEGLFCGARPIVPNLPTYDWYRRYSYVVDMRMDVTEQLVGFLSNPSLPIPPEEYKEIVSIFSWGRIIKDIYTAIQMRL